MNQEEEKEKLMAEFVANVQYLRDNIPPDDIYEFAEQALLSAEFFILRWAEWVDAFEECEKCGLTKLWFQNVIGLKALQSVNQKAKVKLDMEIHED